MNFENVCLESIGYILPDEIVTSTQIEEKLAPLYKRLRLPEGRLELLTGISERRFFPTGTLPSEVSIASTKRAIEVAEFDHKKVGALIHGSVCRDYVEPATACRVHHYAALPSDCFVYDVSNACLGLLNGMLQVASLIESGQIQAGIVVGTELGRNLVEKTIETLNTRLELSRKDIKQTIASLTIGSASCAVLLTDRSLSRSQNSFLGGQVYANTQHYALCHEAESDEARPLMETDSEELMKQGIVTGQTTFEKFLKTTNWSREGIQKTICHQVGGTHRKLMLESLGLPISQDFPSFPFLGNTGSAALPTTLALAAEQGHLVQNDNVALLGIGSGINCVMAALHWQKSLISGGSFS
ncbi:MAG: 3-oxoacyl-ACP synthase III [Pirellulaceae bacterium]|nr:3-oxoacyl-ACP synthase III [Pirellulaceae bacterium]